MQSDWFFVILFYLLDLFFSIMRVALVNVRLPQLIELGTEEPQKLEETITFLEKPRLRAALRLITALMHMILAACVWFVVEESAVPLSLAGRIGILALLAIFLLCSEFLLERIPLKNPEKWAFTLTPIARFFDNLFSPLTKLFIFLQGTNNATFRKLGSVTEDELKTWVEVGESEGGLEPDERKMIYSIFQFGDTLCREIMVPRIEVLALDVKTPLHKAINLVK